MDERRAHFLWADGVSGGAYLIDKDMEVLAYSSSAMSVY